MKVEATWRGPGRLELLVHDVAPAEGRALVESLQSASSAEPEAQPAVGYGRGFEGGVFMGAVWHRWSGRILSDCRRWRTDRATSFIQPYLDEDARLCVECEAAA